MTRFFKNVFSPTVGKRTLFFLIFDVLLIELAVYLAFLLRFEGAIPLEQNRPLLLLSFLAPLAAIPVFWIQRLYWISWSYVGIRDFVKLALGATFSFLLVGVAIFAIRDQLFPSLFSYFPRSTIFIAYILSTVFLGALRASKRIYLEAHPSNGSESKGKKTIIIGAEDTGEQILRSMISKRDSLYRPMGFIDENPFKRDVSIHGYKVIGTIKDIPRIADTQNATAAIIALPSPGSQEIRRAVSSCQEAGIWDIKIVPSLAELLSDTVSLHDLRDIQIEDLLGRVRVELASDAIARFISGKTVLITGAAGSVGSELARQIAKFQPRCLLLLDREETNLFYLCEEFSRSFSHLTFHGVIADIKHRKKIETIFDKWKPEVVFHAAAYKHVPVMEDHPDEAVMNNILGTWVVGEAAIQTGTKKVIFISTDKAVNPTSVMGITKCLAETLSTHLNERSDTDFVSVRFGNVLESRGSVVAIFREQIKRGGPVTVTHPDMKRYFMAPSEAALLVAQAGAVGEGGKVYMLDMGEPIRIEDLAREMIRLSGHESDRDISIVYTKPRPGEKLFEELFRKEQEETRETSYPKIFEVSRREAQKETRDEFLLHLDELIKFAETGDLELLAEKLKAAVARFS